MSEPSAPYNVFSIEVGEPNVGIWWFTKKEEQQKQNITGQPVRLDADLVEWIATPVIVGGGPTRLGVGPYKYTTELEGEVFATNEKDASREWYLVPANQKDTYRVGVDPKAMYVWTAGEQWKPIKIEPFTPGNNKQVFKIVPIFKISE